VIDDQLLKLHHSKQGSNTFSAQAEKAKEVQIERIIAAQSMIKKYVNGQNFTLLTPRP